MGDVMSLSHGYDFSAYQGTTVPKGVFGWCKTSEGTGYKSSKFRAQWASALDNWEVPGAYHYAHPEESSAADQVAMIASMVQLIAGKHTVMLDLEASKLSQQKTNDWAKAFGDECRKKWGDIITVAYLGGGYATNGTGKGLANYFDHWVYPQYPSVYRLGAEQLSGLPGHINTIDEARALSRSAYRSERFALSAPKSNWPDSMAQMYLPSGAKENTGWLNGPIYWQFSDNHAPGGIDASVSSQTAVQLLGGSVTPWEGKEMQCGTMDTPPGVPFGFPFQTGAFHQIGLYVDNTFTDAQHIAVPPVKLRVALLRSDGSHQVVEHVTVGRADAAKTDAVKYVVFDKPKTTRAISITREDNSTIPVGFMLD